jgi:hypothetical protein
MSLSPLSARELLLLLDSNDSVPGFEASDVETVRRALASPSEVPPADLLKLPAPLALALLEAAVQKRRSDLAEAFVDAPDKAVAKGAKKSLYQLRSLGVAVVSPKPPAVPTQAPSAHAAAPVEEEAPPSLLSAVTGTGERALIVARPARGSLELFQMVLSDEFGIVHLVRSEVSRGNYRRQLKEIRAGRAAPAMEVPLAEAKRLLAIASGLNLSSKTPYPDGLDAAMRRLAIQPDAEGALAPLPPAAPEDDALAATGMKLHAEPEMGPWLPPEPLIRELGEKLDKVVHSPLELSAAQKQQQWLDVFRNTAAEFFSSPDNRRLYARRLWAMAEFFETMGRPEPASLARASAKKLFHGPTGDPTPFGSFLFEKVLHFMLQAKAAEKGMDPDAVPMPEPAPAATERKSPGGLILP